MGFRTWFSWSCCIAFLTVGTMNSAAHVSLSARYKWRPPLRLSGGEDGMDFARVVERSATGVISADEAVNLRSMGFLKGPWQAESEVEPESDVQDAHEAQWPDDWAGEEETGDIMRLTPGPVRLYASNKYNHETLPTGRVKPETIKRLAKQLEDDEAFQSVPIESGPESVSEPSGDGPLGQQDDKTSGVVGGFASQLTVPNGEGRRETKGGYEEDGDSEIVASLSAKPTEVYKGVPLLEGMRKEDVDKWLNEAHFTSGDSQTRFNRGPNAMAADVPNLDLVGVDRPKERIEAEHRLDVAIENNDADAVEACIEEIKRIDEAAGK